MKRADSARLVLILLLLSLISPSAAAAVDVSISASPNSQEADSDNPAEYDITVTNTGDDDITVSLSASNAADCNGFTSNVEQVSGTIESGSSETVLLTVSVNEQASGECETTVTVTATGVTPGQPKTDDVKVTTTAGDGGLYSVTLTVDDLTVTYDGEDDQVVWEVDVENTGEQQENIQLEMVSDNDCESDDLDATVSPATVQLDSEESTTVDVTVDLPDGSSTEAGIHCFIIKATVSNDPNAADPAEDNLTLTVNIPEVKECEPSLQFTSMNLNPGETGSNRFTVENIGNTEWTVAAKATADDFDVSGWVDFASPSNAFLGEKNTADDQHTFEFQVTPDDSVEASTQVPIKIQGRSGTEIGCEKILTLNVGQAYDASASLSQSSLSNVEPGTSKSVTMTITNQGNGVDTIQISAANVPTGWQVSFSQSSVTLPSSQSSNNQGSVTIDVLVPAGATAGSDSINFNIGHGGGSIPYATKTLSVSVAQVHDLTTSIISDSQKGKSNQIVRYPIDITNTGNVNDNFKLQACDPNDITGCNSPLWESTFSNNQGVTITQISIDYGVTKRVYLDVTIEGEENGDRASVSAVVTIFGTSVSSSHIFNIEVSNFNYGMSITPAEPGEIPDELQVKLPPGGTGSVSFWVENIGDFPNGDNAVITVNGMESTVLRTLTVNGVETSEPFHVDVGPENRVLITLDFEVLEGIQSGASGLIKVSAASELNAIESTSVNLLIDVITIHDLRMVIEEETSKTVNYPEKAIFMIYVTNYGNVEETVVIESSEPLRFWSINAVDDEFKLAPGETRSVEIRVTPPNDLFQDDTYDFTIIVMPKGLPVAGQPLDLSVTAEVSQGLALLSDEVVQILGWVSILIGALLVIILVFRSRNESRRILEALELKSKP
ncbi:MAG: NEW3 domain-containing protein [Candidatus Thalassarchaeaceae archaeon]|nr:NEW3 domain-containing protein [Candidatus Thalassarchaeaceae archaeon]